MLIILVYAITMAVTIKNWIMNTHERIRNSKEHNEDESSKTEQILNPDNDEQSSKVSIAHCLSLKAIPRKSSVADIFFTSVIV